MQFIGMELKIPFDWHFEFIENENIFFCNECNFEIYGMWLSHCNNMHISYIYLSLILKSIFASLRTHMSFARSPPFHTS